MISSEHVSTTIIGIRNFFVCTSTLFVFLVMTGNRGRVLISHQYTNNILIGRAHYLFITREFFIMSSFSCIDTFSMSRLWCLSRLGFGHGCYEVINVFLLLDVECLLRYNFIK